MLILSTIVLQKQRFVRPRHVHHSRIFFPLPWQQLDRIYLCIRFFWRFD